MSQDICIYKHLFLNEIILKQKGTLIHELQFNRQSVSSGSKAGIRWGIHVLVTYTYSTGEDSQVEADLTHLYLLPDLHGVSQPPVSQVISRCG